MYTKYGMVKESYMDYVVKKMFVNLKGTLEVEQFDEDDGFTNIHIIPGIYEYRELDINGWIVRQIYVPKIDYGWIDVPLGISCEHEFIKTYPDYIMKPVREILGYAEKDTSHDFEIMMLHSKTEILDAYLEYEGFIHYTETIKDCVSDIFGVNLDD